jgi:hypothetical protein
MAARSAAATETQTLEATMIDPFFFDRLMHAFTTTNATPLSQAAYPPREATPCRAVREAEAVVAEVLHRERTTQAAPNPADDHAREG